MARTCKLADSRADAAAGTAIDLKPLPMLEAQNGETFAFDKVQESTGAIIFDYQPGIQVGWGLYYDAVDGQYVTGLTPKNTSDPSTLYIVTSVEANPDPTAPSQWLVKLKKSDGTAVMPTLDPAIIGADGTAYAFALAGSAITLKQAQPGFTTGGQSFTYREALGLQVPTLTDGATYYLVKDPDDTTNTVFRLAASQADAINSNGFSDTVAIGTADQNVMSGSEHSLAALNPGGVSITATLTTTDGAVTKSGQGGEPETSDAATKGELLPVVGTLLQNLSVVGKVNPDGSVQNAMDDRIAGPNGLQQANDFALAASVAFVNSNNTATVEIGGTVSARGNLTADADIAHKIQTQAEAVRAPNHQGTAKANIAGSGAIAMAYDTASVIIDGGASIDASNAMNLSAEVTYPFLVPLDSPQDFFSFIEIQLASDPLGSLSGLLGNVVLLKQDFVNSWARAVDNDPNANVSAAGALDFQYRETKATVDVLGGAKLNQDTDYRTTNQSISLDANTSLDMINVGGIFDYDLTPEAILKSIRGGSNNNFQPFGAQGGKVAFGGAFRVLDLHTTTHAIIHGADSSNNATQVYTDAGRSLDLNAENEVWVLGLTMSGGKSDKFGITGAGAYTRQETSTVAAIQSGAHVNAGPTNIRASDDTVLPTVSGDVVKGKNLGIGMGLVYNEINRTTQAYIGDITSVSTAASNMTLGGVDIQASATGRIFGFALAAAVADNDSTSSSGSTSNSPPVGINPFTNQPMTSYSSSNPAPSGGNYGVAVSGDVVYNQMTDATQAAIDDAGTITLRSGSGLFLASNDDHRAAGPDWKRRNRRGQ